MSEANPVISIIIPHKNHLHTLGRLLNSIPQTELIEIIVVDNQESPLSYEDLFSRGINRTVRLFHAESYRYAGGACNVGLSHAKGQWLLFAGADDYFMDDAFDLFLSRIDSNADIVFSCMTGWNELTSSYSDRGEIYTKLIRDYLTGMAPEQKLRFLFHSQCCKMFNRRMIEQHHIQFSEVKTGNDALFSVKAGYYAKEIEVFDRVTYVATISGQNISRQYDFDSVLSRYKEDLKINLFLRRHRQWRWQLPVWESIKPYGWRKRFRMMILAFLYRQPLWIDKYTYARY